MDDGQKRRLDGQRTDEFSETDRQLMRYVSARFLDEFPSPELNLKRQQQHDALQLVFGWIPPIVLNWKKLVAAGIIALYFGGEPLINSLTEILAKMGAQ